MKDQVILKGKVKQISPNTFEVFGKISATISTKFKTTTFNLMNKRNSGVLCYFNAPAKIESY